MRAAALVDRDSPWCDARVLVAGLGVSGTAATMALAGLGARVRAIDAAAELAAERVADLAGVAEIEVELAAGALIESGSVPTVAGVEPDVLVVSPGWPPTSPLVLAAKRAGIPTWSDVELAWRLQQPAGTPRRGAKPAPWLAITGTNGKTTTVELLAHLLNCGGERAIAAGNVGLSIVAAVMADRYDVIALEASSFQLERTSSMAAEAAVCLNVAPDHLDWHGGIEAYAAAKARIYRRARLARVYPVGDPRIEAMVQSADDAETARAVGVRMGVPSAHELGIVSDVLVDRAFGSAAGSEGIALACFDDLPSSFRDPSGQPARHLLFDTLAAAALARAHGVSPESIREGLRTFTIGPHRIETVAEHHGVRYVDDSKATNAHAASSSLAAFAAGSVVWIAGGLAKGAEFDDLVAAQAHQLAAVVLIGVDRRPLREALARHAPQIPVFEVPSGEPGHVDGSAIMQLAVRAAQSYAHECAGPTPTVLLAPACASMDQFTSYAQRGDFFARAVRDLTAE